MTPVVTLGTPQSRSNLARQFAGASAALAAVTVVLIAAASWWWIDRVQQDAARALQQREVQGRAAQVGETIGRIEERAQELANSPLIATALTDSMGRNAYLLPYLSGIQSINSVRVELMLVDFQGTELARNGDLTFTEEDRRVLLSSLVEGKAVARVTTGTGPPSLLMAKEIRYPRTQTVEGAIWIKLPLSSIKPSGDYTLNVDVSADSSRPDRFSAQVPLPSTMPRLTLAVEQDFQRVPHLQASPYAAGLVLSALLILATVIFVGQRLARGLTSDLAALDRFAKGVTNAGLATERAPMEGSEEVVGLASSINLMLDKLNSQHETLQSEARSQLHLLATCIATVNDVVMITEADPDHPEGNRIVFVNPAFTRVTGYSMQEVLGRGPKLLQGPDTDRRELQRVGRSLRRWEPVRAELLNYTKAGVRYWIDMEIVPVKDIAGRVTHWVAIERDVSARREAEIVRLGLEQQVRESQKMEAIGTLAGGIAHDFNNILGAILGNVALARDHVPAGSPAALQVEQIGRSASRARSLVQQILTYSRRQHQVQEPQELCLLIQEAISLLRATVTARVEFRTVMPAHSVVVLGDATQLAQVLVNLGTNAWQALTVGSDAFVEFGLEVDNIPTAFHGSAKEGLSTAHAHLWVRDNGCGMSPETLARVFEPFFTTKPVGTGTGLGLSVVQGIVRSHRGSIDVQSKPGVGTTFHVRLPLLHRAALEEPQLPANARPKLAHLGHGERVLYVDDDEVMMVVAAALLERWGYSVTALSDASTALTRLRATGEEFDLVVTDLNMPKVSGIELLREIRKLRPDLPVILTSGFISDEMSKEATEAGAEGIVRKENLEEDLASLVAQSLFASQHSG